MPDDTMKGTMPVTAALCRPQLFVLVGLWGSDSSERGKGWCSEESPFVVVASVAQEFRMANGNEEQAGLRASARTLGLSKGKTDESSWGGILG